MRAQQQDSKKNYIGIVNDQFAEQRAIESLAKSGNFVRDYFLALVAALLKRRRGARS
jgi:hypothetical protein